MSSLLNRRSIIETYLPSIRGWWCWLKGISWTKILDKSELEAQAQQVIRDVIQKSRLSYAEKIDVTEDLMAHFQDGMEAGVTLDQLIRDFGDTTTAAQLIRSSKLKNRPWSVMVAKYLAYGILVLLVAYAGLAIYFQVGQAVPNVDYVAQLNDSLQGADADQHAWPLYRKTVALLPTLGKDFEQLVKHDADGAPSGNGYVNPGDANWDAAVAIVKRISPRLQEVRLAAQRESFGLQIQTDPRDYSEVDFEALFPGASRDADMQQPVFQDADKVFSDSMYAILLPHIQPMRQATWALNVEAKLAMTEGDTNRATDNVCAMLGVARHVRQPPFLVCQFASNSIQSEAVLLLQHLLSDRQHRLQDSQLERISQELRRNQFMDIGNLDWERKMIHDLIQRSFTDNGSGDGHMTAAGIQFVSQLGYRTTGGLESNQSPTISMITNIVAPGSLFLIAGRKKTTGKADELMDLAEKELQAPYWKQPDSILEPTLAKQFDHSLEYLPLVSIVPNVHNSRMHFIKSATFRQAALAGIAAEQFRQTHSKWPETQTELVEAGLMDEVAMDPFSGTPLKFVTQPTGALRIYSIGYDRDDDQGRPVTRRAYGSDKPQPIRGLDFSMDHNRAFYGDGDWIIWESQAP